MTLELPGTTPRGVHGGIPTWFRTTCYEAARDRVRGYQTVGEMLRRALSTEIPEDLTFDEWTREVDKLDELLAGSDDGLVWGWFCDHYPRLVRLIPIRRRHQFIAGVRHRYAEEGNLVPFV